MTGADTAQLDRPEAAGVAWEMRAAPRRIGTLQYLRAVAALSVVLYHASFFTRDDTGDASFLSVFGGGFGTFGVLVFFALSGYLMAVQARAMPGQPMRFMLHRLARIYPIFWLVCFLKVAVAFSAGKGGVLDPLVLMLSPVGERDYALGVEWTLVYEVAFYLFVCVLVASRLARWAAPIGAAWVLAIFAHAALYGRYSPYLETSLLQMPLSSVCCAFAAGLAVPAVLARGWVGPSSLAAGAFLVALGALPQFVAFYDAVIGLGCAAIVGWAASLPQGGVRSPVLGRLGDWSYATYLVHATVMTAVARSAMKGGSLGLWAFMVLAALAATPLLGWADVALHRRLRRAVDGWGWRAQASVLAAFAVAYAGCMGLSVAQGPGDAWAANLVPAGGASLVQDLEQAGWRRDERLAGFLGYLARKDGAVTLAGWVNDPADILNRTAVLFRTERTAGSAVPHSYRFDILHAYGRHRAVMPTAFHLSIPDAACPPGTTVQAVAVSKEHKVFRLLDVADCPA